MTDAGETPEFRAMIERSSLGTPGARRLRARTPQAQADLVGQIIRYREDLADCRQSGDRHGALAALAGLAGAYHALGRDDEAMALASDPATIPGADPPWVRAALATVSLALGRPAEANGLYQDYDDEYDDYGKYGKYSGYGEYGDAAADAPERQAARKENTGGDLDSGRQPSRHEPEPARPVNLAHVTTLHPRSYNEARVIGEHLRDGTPVIMNLTEMADSDAKRLVDFAAGLIFGLRGSIDRVTNRVFLLCPADIEVTVEDKTQPEADVEDDAPAAKWESFGRGQTSRRAAE